MSRLAFPALFLLSTCIAFPASGQTRLAWQLKEKDQFYVQWKMLKMDRARNGVAVGETMEDVRLIARFTVLKADEEGYELEKNLSVVEHRSIGAGKPNPLLAQLKGSVLRVKLDKELRVTHIEGMDHLVGPKVGDGLLPHQKKQLEQNEQFLRTWYYHLFVKLPEKEVRPGDTWTEKPVRVGNALYEQDRAYRYQKDLETSGKTLREIQVSAKHRVLRDDSVMRVEDLFLSSSHYQGTVLFDAKAGRMVRGHFETVLEGSAKTRPFPGARPVNMFSAFSSIMTVEVSKENPAEARPVAPIKLVSHREPGPGLPKEWTNSLGMKLVLLPQGKFTMGDKASGATSTEEPYEVEITRPGLMGAHEVTIGQFRKFVDETGYKPDCERSPRGCFGWNKDTGKLECSPKYSWKNPGWEHNDNHPVVNLTWEDAKSFCQWLSKKEGKNYRMPTEAEWEYACRAGSTTTYSTGDDSETLVKVGNITDAAAKKLFPEWQCHRGDDGFAFTSPVGSFPPNAFGIHDLHGNALEFCEDWFYFYPKGAHRDPQGPTLGFLKVQRGGSFADFPQHCTSAHRMSYALTNYCISSGFRVVCCEETPSLYHKPLTWVGKTVLPRNPDEMAWLTKDHPRPLIMPALGVSREHLGIVNVTLPGNPALEKTELIPLEEAIDHFTQILDRAQTARTYYLRSTAHFARGEEAASLKDLNEAINLDDQNPWFYVERSKFHHTRKDYVLVGKDLEKAVELKDNNPYLHNALAWFLATNPDKELRDGKKAIEHARRAKELTTQRDGNILDTLAAAFAEAGQFKEAVRYQTEALEDPTFALSSGPPARQRLEMYRRKEAFRHPAP